MRQFDPAYFERLRQRVQAAGQRGIYVGIMLFQGVAGTGPRTWPGHVFNRDNNINGIDGNGTDTQTLRSSAVTEIQKAYIRKVIDTVNDLDNVLYEISNEAHAATTDWQYEMIRFIQAYQADKPNWKGQAETGERARRAMGETRRFAERMNLAATAPHGELSSTGYCLADPAREYVVYQPRAGAFTVALNTGKYRYEWFSPAEGKSVGSGEVETPGGSRQFKPPRDGDIVLYLRAVQ